MGASETVQNNPIFSVLLDDGEIVSDLSFEGLRPYHGKIAAMKFAWGFVVGSVNRLHGSFSVNGSLTACNLRMGTIRVFRRQIKTVRPSDGLETGQETVYLVGLESESGQKYLVMRADGSFAWRNNR